MALQLVVNDEQGHELDAKSLSQIPLGFDTELKEGEFYEAPTSDSSTGSKRLTAIASTGFFWSRSSMGSY